MADDTLAIRNNEATQRYEVAVDGAQAVLAYRREGDHTIAYLHTEVPEALEGRGIGSALARAALEEARTQGLTVVPYCPFVSAYIRRHHEYLPLVDPAFRARLAEGAS